MEPHMSKFSSRSTSNLHAVAAQAQALVQFTVICNRHNSTAHMGSETAEVWRDLNTAAA